MSWPRRVSWVMVAGAVIAGCGFQPLHAPRTGASAPDMASIRIVPITDRVGQQLHNLLLDKLTPAGPPKAPRYALHVKLGETLRSLAVRKDDVATRANLVMNASFELVRVLDEKVLLSNSAVSANSYNILRQEFGTLSAENNARARAVRELSEQISTRVAIYLRRVK